MGEYVGANGVISRMTLARVQSLCAPRTGSEVYDYVDEVIERAESRVDSFASVRWQTPLPDSACADEWVYSIVEYELYKNGPGGDVQPKIKDSYDMTMKTLLAMGAGQYEPRGAVALVSNSDVGYSVDALGDPPQFAYNLTRYW